MSLRPATAARAVPALDDQIDLLRSRLKAALLAQDDERIKTLAAELGAARRRRRSLQEQSRVR